MIDKNDNILLRQIIMERYTNPLNKRQLNEENVFSELQESSTCSDEINLQIYLVDKIIEDIAFTGNSCAISTCSTDILCSILKRKNIEECLIVLDNFNKMILREDFDEKLMGELICLWKVSDQPNRVNCALLGANGMKNFLLNSKG